MKFLPFYSLLMAFSFVLLTAFAFPFATINTDLIKPTNDSIYSAPFTTAFSQKTIPLVQMRAGSFGFSASADAAKNTKALQQISAAINAQKGGVELIFDKGQYTVGGETFSKGTGKGYAYAGQTMLKIEGCTKPVLIQGNGAVLKMAAGLHFGAFHPVTGKPHHAKGGGFFDGNYMAIPQMMIQATNNESVIIKNLVLDGNSQNIVVGGYWGDTGIQLAGDGIYGGDNKELIVDGVTSRFFPRDGIQVGNTTPNEKAPVKKVFLINSVFTGNGRQGFSWVGGNHLLATNCTFSNTGKTVNAGLKAPLVSAPGAGVDMEAELGLIRNGVFENCIIDNNNGAGLLSVGDVASIKYKGGKIIGATNWSIYGTGPKAVFEKVTIVGSPVNLRSGTGPMDADNARFNNCFITMDTTLSPTGKVYGNYVMDFGGGAGGFFTQCTIDSKNRGTVYGGGGCVFTDCTFKQGPPAPGINGYPFMSGIFYGTNHWQKPGGTDMPPNLERSKFYGPFYVNGVDVTKGLRQK